MDPAVHPEFRHIEDLRLNLFVVEVAVRIFLPLFLRICGRARRCLRRFSLQIVEFRDNPMQVVETSAIGIVGESRELSPKRRAIGVWRGLNELIG